MQVEKIKSTRERKNSGPPAIEVDLKGAKRLKQVLQVAGVKKVELNDHVLSSLLDSIQELEKEPTDQEKPRSRNRTNATLPEPSAAVVQIAETSRKSRYSNTKNSPDTSANSSPNTRYRSKPTDTDRGKPGNKVNTRERKRAAGFTIPWMKLSTNGLTNRRKLRFTDITVGNKVSAQYTDNVWYESKVVMVTDGLRGVMYGIVFPHSMQVYQLPRTKIRTEEDLRQTADVADRLRGLNKGQMERLTQRLSVCVQDYRASVLLQDGGNANNEEGSDWSDWSISVSSESV